MDNPGSLVPLDRLLAHRAWVRRVARALVRDENAADDLEQGVWLEAMESPPRTGGSLRAWLASVMRHNLVDLRRSEARRRVREVAAAAPEPHSSTADVVAQADLHRRIVVALMELPEPYRGTVLLRYFHDLDSPAISRRMGVPAETVRTRLARGIAMLRSRLGAGGRADRGAWAFLLHPVGSERGGLSTPTATASATVAGGGVLMKASTALSVGAAVLLTIGLGWALFRPAGAPVARVEAKVEGRTQPRPSGDAAVTGPNTTDVDPIGPGPAQAPPAESKGTSAAEEPAHPPGGLPRHRLPRFGGLDPVPTERHRVDILMDARGAMTVGGASVNMTDLVKYLRDAAERSREDGEQGPSRVDVVVRADRDLPWQGAQWLLQACADPTVQMNRIHFAAASEDGGSEGVLPTFLPAASAAVAPAPGVEEVGSAVGGAGTDGAGPKATLAKEVPVIVPLRLSHDASNAPVTAEDLFAHLQENCAAFLEQGATVLVDASPSVALGEVLGAVVAARRWGAKSIVFRGTPVLKGEYVENSLISLPSTKGSLAIKVLGSSVVPK